MAITIQAEGRRQNSDGTTPTNAPLQEKGCGPGGKKPMKAHGGGGSMPHMGDGSMPDQCFGMKSSGRGGRGKR